MSTITTKPVFTSQFLEPKTQHPKVKLTTFIKPKYETKDSKYPYVLTPWDLPFLSATYIQNGLLFPKPKHCSIEDLLESLKDSLSHTLVHFYPLAGRLATQVDENRHECMLSVDCNKGPGVRFIYATLDMTMFDILSPKDVPSAVHSLFDHNGAVSHDGHTQPLLSVQVTELLDGIFIGVSMNHMLADGTSFWHFWNMWSEIHNANDEKKIFISCPPVFNQWFDGDCYGRSIPLPFTHPDEFISRYEAPDLKERFFHFSSASIAKLKARANEEMDTHKISSFQALTALVWRSIVRAKRLAHDQVSHCGLSINNRHRLDPPLPQNYFGNSINVIKATTTAGELLEHNLGWAALLVHQSIAHHTNEAVHDLLKEWLQSPFVYQLEPSSSFYTLVMMNSPRFDIYGNEFGLGKAVAVRSGRGMNKFSGVVVSYPGYEGGGSVDLEICLPLDSMEALESDEEFMAAVSLPPLSSKHLTV